MKETIKQETFQVTLPNICWENSFGTFGASKNVLCEFNVGIKDEGYGYFEFYDLETGGERYYAEGGLWFLNGLLTDYDGVCELPEQIISKLKEWGYTVDENIEVE